MYFYIFDLHNLENTNKVIDAISTKIKTQNFNLHNLHKLEDENIFKFNIVLQKNTKNVISNETWYKVSNGFISLDNFLFLIPEFPDKTLIDSFKNEVIDNFNVQITLKDFTKDNLELILNDKENYINKVSYINDENEFMEKSINVTELLDIDNKIELIEVSYFTKSNSLVRFASSGQFYCNSEKALQNSLHIFNKVSIPSI